MKGISDAATEGGTVRLAPVRIQPVHSDDVAAAVGRTAVGTPVNGVVEVAPGDHPAARSRRAARPDADRRLGRAAAVSGGSERYGRGGPFSGAAPSLLSGPPREI